MEIEDRINYHFKDKGLLNEALSHSSYGNEFSQRDNERLEFLGDSIISFLVTKHLFSIFPESLLKNPSKSEIIFPPRSSASLKATLCNFSTMYFHYVQCIFRM